MVAFGQAMLKYNTVLFHASVIEKDGSGYAFLGRVEQVKVHIVGYG